MKANQFAVGTSAIGIVLVLVSMAFTLGIFPSLTSGGWQEEDAIEFSRSAVALHHETFDQDATKQSFKMSDDRYRTNREQLDLALKRRSAIPKVLRVIGYGFVVIGLGCYVYAKVRDPD